MVSVAMCLECTVYIVAYLPACEWFCSFDGERRFFSASVVPILAQCVLSSRLSFFLLSQPRSPAEVLVLYLIQLNSAPG